MQHSLQYWFDNKTMMENTPLWNIPFTKKKKYNTICTNVKNQRVLNQNKNGRRKKKRDKNTQQISRLDFQLQNSKFSSLNFSKHLTMRGPCKLIHAIFFKEEYKYVFWQIYWVFVIFHEDFKSGELSKWPINANW